MCHLSYMCFMDLAISTTCIFARYIDMILRDEMYLSTIKSHLKACDGAIVIEE